MGCLCVNNLVNKETYSTYILLLEKKQQIQIQDTFSVSTITKMPSSILILE